jgi:hypothetical protein
MFAANTYRIRLASAEEVDALTRFAQFDSEKPITGRALIGYLDGVPAAVLSLDDGRAFVDPSRHTDHLVANLRARAAGVRAYEESDSLRQRLLAGIPASFLARASAASGSMSRNGHSEHVQGLVVGSEQHARVQHVEHPGLAGACVNAVMGPANRAPGIGIMGDSDRPTRRYLMGQPDSGLRVDVMGGPDGGPSVRLMGESDPTFLGVLFARPTGISRRRESLKQLAEARWSLALQPAGQP